ncbi:MAG: metal ABC transporter permease [Spirochaetes bacterium]|nr:metal ABC transporter permease [Spirochaetota bacterium]
MTDSILYKSLFIIILTGIQCGIIGVFIFLLNIPFIGVTLSHSAMAGGIWGMILGLPSRVMALGFSLLSSLFIPPLSEKSRISPNIAISILFSFVLGIAFLGMGLLPQKGVILDLLWGNILLVDSLDIIFLIFLLFALGVFIAAFFKELVAILFNREIAASLGINDRLFFYVLLFFVGAVITVNLNIIGGLLLFSLIIIPPSIAYQITYDIKKFIFLSSFFASLGGAGGVIFSFTFNWPVSATVAIFLSFILLIVYLISPKRRVYAKVD